MTSDHPHDSHGNTVAAWTAVTIMLIGCTISALAFWLTSPLTFWVGVGVVVIGAITGKVLQAMGLGAKPAAADSGRQAAE